VRALGAVCESAARSDAMWFAEHYDVLETSLKRCRYTNPSDVRRWCRDQGIEIAGETKRQKKRSQGRV
jgi:hypothetical protein